MTYLTESQARGAANEQLNVGALRKSVDVLIEESRTSDANKSSFDIFLSHSIRDKELVIGAKRILEKSGRTVYVDWIVDGSLDRSKVSGATAEKLRIRMQQCTSLIYLYSNSSQFSRWMPWELGYFDGHNGNVAILPILPDYGELDFAKEEYLQIYPKVDFLYVDSPYTSVFINKSRGLEPNRGWKTMRDWTNDPDKLRPTA